MIPNIIILSGETHIERNGVYKRSRLRERILEMLKSTETHPTADWIYDRLKREFPKLSMGTVYRNLNILVDQGVTQRIDFGSTFGRFDANIASHYHFICERCGSITDLELPVNDGLNERVKKATPFTVHRHRIEFYGVCDRCKGEAERG